MTADAGMPSDSPVGRRWERVSQKLAQWLRRHALPPLDPEDIASEVVERGLRAMDVLAWSWPELWNWSKKTGLNYRTDQLRAHRSHPVRLLPDPDRCAFRNHAPDSPNSWAIVEELRREVDGLQLQVLEALRSEHITNAEMAQRFGKSKRAIEAARRALRLKAAELVDRDRQLRS